MAGEAPDQPGALSGRCGEERRGREGAGESTGACESVGAEEQGEESLFWREAIGSLLAFGLEFVGRQGEDFRHTISNNYDVTPHY